MAQPSNTVERESEKEKGTAVLLFTEAAYHAGMTHKWFIMIVNYVTNIRLISKYTIMEQSLVEFSQ